MILVQVQDELAYLSNNIAISLLEREKISSFGEYNLSIELLAGKHVGIDASRKRLAAWCTSRNIVPESVFSNKDRE